MCCEPTLRAWLIHMLSEIAMLVEEPEAGTEPQAEPEAPAPGEWKDEGLADDTRSMMDTLRLCIKYVIFDVQATHRENQCLRKLLEQYQRQDGEV